MPTQDPARFASAAARFRSFFLELEGAFVEREDVLRQVALGLLSKEHILLAGPPGTAKSQIASGTLGRVVCEDGGGPSLYARQVTESTVQTDLIGPIDFKNLTETGRTTHFTDEGMLGSVHAFLDEVFDGRDMLLRSALNVLQERELKQGGAITKGRIECALMTSNRYITDVLEQSRDTLLAFVDRIAFVGFVPRGFADPKNLAVVLRRRVGGMGSPGLDALLTIQDVDVLQSAVASVYVAPEVCDALADLLGRLEIEMSAAQRADPAFVPTRYISTRTAVRCGGILRAACVYDRIFHDPDRELEVRPADLSMLRLHLLLSGPSPDQVRQLLQRETDPIERRQLTVLATERELFEACLAKVPAFTPGRRPKAPEAPKVSPKAASAGPKAIPSATEERLAERELDRLARRVSESGTAGDFKRLVEQSHEIAELARDGSPNADEAKALLERVVAAIETVGLRRSLPAGDVGTTVLAAVRAIAEIAQSLEDGTVSMHATARWMHRRALSMIEDAASFTAGAGGTVLTAALAEDGGDPVRRTHERLQTLGELARLRASLLAQAAAPGTDEDPSSWARTLLRAEHEIAALWSHSFSVALARPLTSKDRGLGAVLAALDPELEKLANVDLEMAKVTGTSSRVKERVAGPRVGDVVRASLLNHGAPDRSAIVAEIRTLKRTLDEHGLDGALDVASWLGWTAEALVLGEPPLPADDPSEPTRAGYRHLRDREQRTPILCVLAEVALLLSPGPATGSIGALSDAAMKDVLRLDLARIERALTYLERWWTQVEASSPSDVRDSKILELFWEEAALARFSFEARLIEELAPSARQDTLALRVRLSALNDRAHAKGIGFLVQRSDEAWAGSLASALGPTRAAVPATK